jgi:hypothetical protein
MFFAWLKNMFIKFFKLAGHSAQLNFKYLYIWPIVLVITLAIIYYLGLNIFHFGLKKLYKAETTAIFRGPSINTFKTIMAPIEKANYLGKKTDLSSVLSIPEKVAKSIYKVESYHIIDIGRDSIPDIVDYSGKHDLRDTLDVLMYDRMQLAIFTTDVTQLDLIERQLYNYLNSHPSLVSINEVKHRELKAKLRSVEREIERIDSMATIVYLDNNKPQINITDNSLLIGEQKRQIVSEELLGLHDLKVGLVMELVNYDSPVSFLDNFVLDPLPVNRKIEYLIYILLETYIISSLLCILIDNRKKILNYLKNKKTAE